MEPLRSFVYWVADLLLTGCCLHYPVYISHRNPMTSKVKIPKNPKLGMSSKRLSVPKL